MKSKNLKIGVNNGIDALKKLELQEGVVHHLEQQRLLRDELPNEPLDKRLKKAGKIDFSLNK